MPRKHITAISSAPPLSVKQDPPVVTQTPAPDPNRSSVQAKIVDKPVMFRDRGLHARQVSPGKTSQRFAQSNTNIPLWEGDAATLSAPRKAGDMNQMQRFQGKNDVASRNDKKSSMEHFFVAKQQQQQASAARGGENSAPVDDLHLSRKAIPAEHKDRLGLRPGEFVPSVEASPPQRLGKKPNEGESKRCGVELVHHGKKSFPDKAQTGAATAAASKTPAVVSNSDLMASKRFEQSKRHTSNVGAGAGPKADAPCQEFDYDTRKKHVEKVPGNQSGKTLQYVFEAPKKKVDASYRPAAPW